MRRFGWLIPVAALAGCVTSFGNWPADTGAPDVHDVDGDAGPDGDADGDGELDAADTEPPDVHEVDGDAGPDGDADGDGELDAADADGDVAPDAPADIEPDFAGHRCGDGIVAAWEECDDGTGNAFSAACLPTCRNARCGDGFVWSGHEYCDDGNTASGDACAPDCLDGERIIETVAGGGVCDGLPARAASLPQAVSLVLAPDGNLYFSTGGSTGASTGGAGGRVRRVAPDGRVWTVVGTGRRGDTGDGGSALLASLKYASGIALADAGATLYVSDAPPCRIRRVVGGVIDTYAGHWTCGADDRLWTRTEARLNDPRGLFWGGDGKLYFTEPCRVRRIRSDGVVELVAGTNVCGTSGDGGAATAAQLAGVAGVVRHPDGTVYIGDYVGDRVRRVRATGVIDTLASGAVMPGQPCLHPTGLLVPEASGLCRVELVAYDGSSRTVVAGTGACAFAGDGGPATGASFLGVNSCAVASDGRVFVTDDSRIRRFTIGGNIETFAGNGFANYCGDVGTADGLGVPTPPGGWDYSATNAALDAPYYVAVLADGTVVWTEGNNHVVRMMAPDGTIDTLAGNGRAGYADGAGRAAAFNAPFGIAVDVDGTLLVAEYEGNRIRRIDPGTREVTTVAGTGSPGLAPEGALARSSPVNRPYDLVVGADGAIYVADLGNHRVGRIDAATGQIRTYAGTAGVPGDTGDGGRATSARLTNPAGLGIDAAGVIYVTDMSAHRVRRIVPGTSPTLAMIEAFAGNGVNTRYEGDGGAPDAAGLATPIDVAVDDATGAVFITDNGHNVVRVVRDEGGATGLVIRTATGNGSHDFDGDFGPATRAALSRPVGVATDGTGGIYVADTGNNRIRHARF